ncbi:MAG: hypothetical protein P4L33_03975 [Capsulimonadaceae bacterium]|nr:hypothetical protein [Capsulimonadaceae bacterium]
MESLVSAWIDGRLIGLSRWYTEYHVRTCPQCTASLPFLFLLKARLAALPGDTTPDIAPTLPARRWTAVAAEWERLDREATGP